jgi:alpha-mannosidase
MRIGSITSTDLFVGTAEAPWQVVRVGIELDAGESVGRVTVTGSGVETTRPGIATTSGPVEVAVSTQPAIGTRVPVQVLVDGEPALLADGSAAEGVLEVAEPGWTMHMVSHFHYDPVWWNTQAAYTSEWDDLDFEGSPRSEFQQSGFDLVRAHMGLARRDPDYCFVLAEVDYLKPYWDLYPEDRDYLQRLIEQGRLELMGGTWNEPNTNLTGAELTIRNVIYGTGFQREILGADPQTAWQLDVFGHDPQFPGLMADAGLTSSSWARGPFHQWGPMLQRHDSVPGDATVMQFPSEFEWLSPSGKGVLTAYMANHYGAGWAMDSAPTLADAMDATYAVFRGLKPVAATRNVLLPVGTDYTPPNRWVTQIHREWNDRYVWPRFVCALPRQFFSAVRAGLAERDVQASPQSRDMNPVYTGKDVSFIDTKQAQREAECVLQDGEKWATIAALLGARYPDAALDKAWRQLIYGAHHDGITGSESDQVYLDLLAGWRESRDLAHGVHSKATAYLCSLIALDREGWALTVFNALSWDRSDLVGVRVDIDATTNGLRLRDLDGRDVPFTAEGVERDPDGSLRAATVTFRAADVPSVGHRTWVLQPAADLPEDSTWASNQGDRITNEFHAVTVDQARGGGVSELVDLSTGHNLLAADGVGNELVVYEEYPDHPRFKEGPWHLVPRGSSTGSAAAAAQEVTLEQSALGQRLTVTGRVGPARYTQRITLWHGIDRVEFTTWLDEWTGSDQLVRVRFPTPVRGALPVSEVANAVIGRGFGFPDVDSDQSPWTLDNPAYGWFGLSSTARVRINDVTGGAAGPVSRALGVADVVVPTEDDGGALARELVVALARTGVTATTSSAHGPRYGLLQVDSNLPDFRIAVGGPEDNPFAAEVLARASDGFVAELSRQLDEHGRARLWVPAAGPLAEVWVPNADLREARALPTLVVAGATRQQLLAELSALADDLQDAVIDVRQPAALHPDEDLDDRTVGLLNRGTPSFVVDTAGVLHLSLMRSCTGWPSGVWIDPPARTTPDGSSFQLQHWTHRFDYALVSGRGDWRDCDLVRRGQGYNHRLSAHQHAGDGDQPPDRAFVRVEPDSTVALSVLKAHGNPLARGELGASDPRERLTARLYETTGRPANVKIRAFVPMLDAAPGDLLETSASVGSLVTPDGAVSLGFDGAQIQTVTMRPGDVSAVTGDPASLEDDFTNVAEYARYWLHNRGVAPTGAHPVSVHLHGPNRIDGAMSSLSVRCVVSSDLTKDSTHGEVTLAAPAGWSVEPATVPYDLPPGEHQSADVEITPPAGTDTGTFLITGQLTGPNGAVTQDVLSLSAGPETEPILEADLTVDEIQLSPGDSHDLTVQLTNHAQGTLVTEVQTLTPYGTWEAVPRWSEFVPVPGPGTVAHVVSVAVPGTARPGRYWILVKVMGGGQVVYTPAVPFTVLPVTAGRR